MTASELRDELSQGRTDYEFVFRGKRGSICPFNYPNGQFSADVGYDSVFNTYHTLNELMNAPFLDGKSLTEVAEEIELYG